MRLLVLSAAVLLVGATSADAEVLYDQTTGAPAGSVPSFLSNSSTPTEATGTCDGQQTNPNCYAADDFTIPPGPSWLIQNLYFNGSGGAGDYLIWQAVQADGIPSVGAKNESGFEPQLASEKFAGGGAPIANGADVNTPSLVPQVLEPGHYWLSAYAHGSSASPALWSWQSQTPLSGSPAEWSSRQCNASGAYQVLGSCGQPGTDLRFRIEGEKLGSDYSDFSVGKRERVHNGGLNIYATFPGPPDEQGFVLRKVGGRAKITFLKTLARFERNSSTVGALIRFRPVGATKRALKEGKKVRVKIAISYTREVGPRIRVPTTTKTISVVLKKAH